MYENIRLQTSRLLLRPVSPDDLSTVYAYSSDGEHVKYMKYYPDESMEVCKKFLIQTCQEWSKEFPPLLCICCHTEQPTYWRGFCLR